MKKRLFETKLSFFAFLGLYFNIGTRPCIKLTRKNYLWMAGLSIYALGVLKARIDYKRYSYISILKYSTIYERVIN